MDEDLSDEDVRRILVAAADKEMVEFELDRAALVLEEAVTTAIEHGKDVEHIAQAAELPVEEVIEIAETSHLPVPLTE